MVDHGVTAQVGGRIVDLLSRDPIANGVVVIEDGRIAAVIKTRTSGGITSPTDSLAGRRAAIT